MLWNVNTRDNNIECREVPPISHKIYGRCINDHLSRPILVKRFWGIAAIVRCTARSKRGHQCNTDFLMFDGQDCLLKGEENA